MHFLADVWIECDSCRGLRYNKETLEVKYKGKNIAEILRMTAAEASEFFSAHRAVHRYLKVLTEIGLGYILLGQPSVELSGGEAQRVKMAAELARGTKRRNLYILDEPTTGLHMADIHLLIKVLRRLADAGHTVAVIEHQLNVISSADWVVELGPGGGDAGGRVIFAGTPADLRKKSGSPTGKCLRSIGRKSKV